MTLSLRVTGATEILRKIRPPGRLPDQLAWPEVASSNCLAMGAWAELAMDFTRPGLKGTEQRWPDN